MLNAERPDFEAQLAILFGGHPTFLTPPRIDAYWRGLQKMPLSVFVRCVDESLGPDGDEKLPTVNRIWQISRAMKARGARPSPHVEEQQFGDDYHVLGQRWLLAFLLKCQGVPPEKMPKLVTAKNSIVDQFRANGGVEIDSNVAEWLDVAMTDFARIAAV